MVQSAINGSRANNNIVIQGTEYQMELNPIAQEGIDHNRDLRVENVRSAGVEPWQTLPS